MKVRMEWFVACACLAMSGAAQDRPGQLNSFAVERPRRFEFSLELNDRQREVSAPLDGFGDAARKRSEFTLDRVEQWLRTELPKRAPGITAVSFESIERRTYGLSTPMIQRTRRMIVDATPEARQPIQDVLDKFARQKDSQILATFTIVRRQAAKGDPAIGDGPAARFDPELLTQGEIERARRLLAFEHSAAPESEVLTAPRLLLRNGDTGTVSVGESTKYVKDFTEEIVDGKKLFVPVVDSVFDGIQVETSALVEPDGQTISANVTVSISTVSRPIRTFTTTLASSESYTIQLPEVVTRQLPSGDLSLTADRPCVRMRVPIAPKNPDEKPETIEVLASFSIKPPEPVNPDAKTVVFEGRIAIFDVRDRAELRGAKVGQQLQVVHDGKVVSAFEILRVEGSSFITRGLFGNPPGADDTLTLSDP